MLLVHLTFLRVFWGPNFWSIARIPAGESQKLLCAASTCCASDSLCKLRTGLGTRPARHLTCEEVRPVQACTHHTKANSPLPINPASTTHLRVLEIQEALSITKCGIRALQGPVQSKTRRQTIIEIDLCFLPFGVVTCCARMSPSIMMHPDVKEALMTGGGLLRKALKRPDAALVPIRGSEYHSKRKEPHACAEAEPRRGEIGPCINQYDQHTLNDVNLHNPSLPHVRLHLEPRRPSKLRVQSFLAIETNSMSGDRPRKLKMQRRCVH